MVNHLAKFYRTSLNKGKHIISIEQELELTRHYLAIQQVRFHGLLSVHYDIDESLLHYRTIKLILQPFVENCIHHAIWDDDARVNIRITLSEEDGHILLQVIDDGMGMTADTLARAHCKTDFSSGYGIRNVDGRVKLAFGEQYGVEFYSRLGIGTQVMIRFPKKIRCRGPYFEFEKDCRHGSLWIIYDFDKR